jgi:hypothetical protein
MMNDCNRKIRTINIADVAIDTLPTMVDYFLAERDIMDESTGNTVRTPVRVPSGKIFPNVNNDNVIGIEINNSAITVPENQVRAGYVANEPGANIVRYADANHPAVFLMLGEYMDNVMRIQNTGFVNIPEGHQYLVGATYYVGTNGEPVTDASITGQKLFIPISNTKLAIIM